VRELLAPVILLGKELIRGGILAFARGDVGGIGERVSEEGLGLSHGPVFEELVVSTLEGTALHTIMNEDCRVVNHWHLREAFLGVEQNIENCEYTHSDKGSNHDIVLGHHVVLLLSTVKHRYKVTRMIRERLKKNERHSILEAEESKLLGEICHYGFPKSFPHLWFPKAPP
jgi:hypothetical protein